jgi:hypothetical protein
MTPRIDGPMPPRAWTPTTSLTKHFLLLKYFYQTPPGWRPIENPAASV